MGQQTEIPWQICFCGGSGGSGAADVAVVFQLEWLMPPTMLHRQCIRQLQKSIIVVDRFDDYT